MMLVILTCNYSPWSAYSGGAQRSVHSIATELVKKGEEVKVVYTKSPFEKILPTEEVNYDFEWATLPAIKSSRKALFRNASAFAVKNTVKKLLKENTVVHANGEEAALLGTLKKDKKFKLVSTPRYPYYPEFNIPNIVKPPGFLKMLAVNKYQYLAYTIRNADKVLPTSQYAANFIKKAYQINNDVIQIVPNGIADVFFEVPERNPEPKSCFFFGRLEKTKGIDVLLKAFAQLDDDTRLWVAGNGAFHTEFNEMIDELGIKKRINYYSWLGQHEIAEHLSKAAVVCLPSMEESFGNAMAETMAAGAPLVSTTAGSIPELVTNEKNGLLVSYGDVSALKNALQDLFDHPDKAEKLGMAGCEFAKTITWDKVADQLIKIYGEVLQN